MAALIPPVIDPRDESSLVAEVIDALPASMSDRGTSNPAVKLIEGCGAIYGNLTYWLNQWPTRVMVKLLALLEIEAQDATYATTTLKFTRSASTPELTIPTGTVVKTGLSASAVRFETTEPLTFESGGPLADSVAARAVVAGAAGNVAAGTLVHLNSPISTVSAVTNASAATGGQDEESQESAIARAPLALRANDRAVTAEDFETLSIASGEGVIRAVAESTAQGSVTVHVLASDYNEDESAALQDAVEAYLVARTLPGVEVIIEQHATRVVAIEDVTVTLLDGYTAASVKSDIEDALSGYLTAVDVFDATQTKTSEGLPYGQDLVENDLVPLVAAVEGVKRCVDITAKYSDDYGDSWSASGSLGTISSPNGTWGLMHWGNDYPTEGSVTMTVNGV